MVVVQRPTLSRSGHWSVKFNVQSRILDCVTSISHSAQPRIKIALKDTNVACQTKKLESKLWILFGNVENKDVGLRWKHIALYTV